jgi:hypothetical protein
MDRQTGRDGERRADHCQYQQPDFAADVVFFSEITTALPTGELGRFHDPVAFIFYVAVAS